MTAGQVPKEVARDRAPDEAVELTELVRAGAARWLLALAADYRRTARRANGAAPQLPEGTSRLLVLIAKLDAGAAPTVSDSGHPSSIVADVTGMAPAKVAAEVAGCDPRTARRRALAGAVRSYRAGPRGLLVDIEGLVRDQQRRKANS